MNKAQKNLLKALKEIGVSHYKDMTFEVSFFREKPQPIIKTTKKQNISDLKDIKQTSIEDEVKQMTDNFKIPLLDQTV